MMADTKDEDAAGEAEPKGTPNSDRYQGETAHHDEDEAPKPKPAKAYTSRR